jgi:hypothetical protein
MAKEDLRGDAPSIDRGLDRMGSINTRHCLSHDGIKTPRLLGKADHKSVSRGGLYVTENSALDLGALGAARTGEPQVACGAGRAVLAGYHGSVSCTSSSSSPSPSLSVADPTSWDPRWGGLSSV